MFSTDYRLAPMTTQCYALLLRFLITQCHISFTYRWSPQIDPMEACHTLWY